jgi:hypothetical protein
LTFAPDRSIHLLLSGVSYEEYSGRSKEEAMHRSLHRLTRLMATVALVATAALGVASTALADDWARDRADARAVQEVDPAIRTAIAAHSTEAASPPVAAVSAPALDDGFAWGAAALGLVAGIVGTCVLVGCVNLVRHDGRLRSA